MDYSVVECRTHQDLRGALVEFLRADELPHGATAFGQIYAVTFARPGQVRGNHYHTEGNEWFGCMHGELEVVLEDVRTKERRRLVISATDTSFVRLTVGPFVAHAFRNLSPTAMLMDYCSKQFDPARPDRNPYVLIDPDEPLAGGHVAGDASASAVADNRTSAAAGPTAGVPDTPDRGAETAAGSRPRE